MRREYRRITERTRRLLAMPEGVNVDFKRETTAVHASDLVAFANAATGGTLLIGIDEYTTSDGVQRGRVVGCDVDDSARLSLVNKATGCYPNIDVEIFTENLAAKPILRIEIPSGHARPYCTQSGQYMIRADGRNRALYPEELLSIFMDREGEQFLSRFRNAVFRLEHQVSGISHSLSDGLLLVSQHIHDLDDQLKRTHSRIDQLTDSNKKRSRNMLQAVRDSQDSIGNLERLLNEGRGSRRYQALLKEIEDKLAGMLETIGDSGGDN
ncbi:MAG: ATP-binding protein [Oceanospirillaceae bacterium]|nr:ATP-binding protein [Oceanospirillaceae bacterium]